MIPLNTILGDLKLDEVFIEYDGPQLFTCVDEESRRLIAVHAPATETDNWIYAYISFDRLSGVREGSISLRDAFLFPEQKELLLVRFYHDGNVRVTIEVTSSSELSPDWLPDEGEFLEPYRSTVSLVDFSTTPAIPDLRQGEFSHIGELVLKNPPHIPELPKSIAQLSPMWDLSTEALDFLRANRTPISTVATRTGRFVFDIALKSGDMRTDVPVKDLASFLNSSQKVIESFTSDLSSDPSMKRRGLKFQEETRLSAIASFPSSFGLRIETQASLFAHPAVSSALQRLLSLLSTGGSKTETEELLHGLSNTSVLHFRSFAKAIAKSQTGFSMELGTPGQEETQSAVLGQSQLENLIRVLDAKSTRDEHPMEFAGKLIGVSLKTKFFMLEGEHNTVSGRVSEQCMNSMYGKKIGQTYQSVINVITDVDEISGNESEKYVLLEIGDAKLKKENAN